MTHVFIHEILVFLEMFRIVVPIMMSIYVTNLSTMPRKI